MDNSINIPIVDEVVCVGQPDFFAPGTTKKSVCSINGLPTNSLSVIPII